MMRLVRVCNCTGIYQTILKFCEVDCRKLWRAEGIVSCITCIFASYTTVVLFNISFNGMIELNRLQPHKGPNTYQLDHRSGSSHASPPKLP